MVRRQPSTPRAAARAMVHAGYRQAVRPLSHVGWLRPVLHAAYNWVTRRRSWMRPHPFDAAHGVRTDGYVPWWLLGEAGQARESNLGYGGCQPSCLRRVLETIPHPGRMAFLDLGCGKGRGLIVASEFRFQRVIGIEIDAGLCRTCRANAATIKAAFPGRPAIEVLEGDATSVPLPPGDLVVFIYHAFGSALLQRLLERLLAPGDGRLLFVIYQNPVFGHLLDQQSGMRRWFAQTVACEAEERGVGSGGSETVVCWVSRGHPAPSLPGAEAAIVVERESASLG